MKPRPSIRSYLASAATQLSLGELKLLELHELRAAKSADNTNANRKTKVAL